jgi:phosphoribosylglycinamide formyltransferase-1
VKNVVILISGRGSNMQSLVHAGIPAKIAAVVSNRPEAPGLGIAAQAGVPTAVVDDRDFASRSEFDAALARVIDRYSPAIVALAGFMRILSGDFVRRYEGRLLNIHPSLLPSFPGLHTHRRALEEGVKVHGCTVHFVTAELDRGPIIVQAAVPVHADDTEERLAARVLRQEHHIYPLAVRWCVEDRLVVEDGRVRVDAAGGEQALLAAE